MRGLVLDGDETVPSLLAPSVDRCDALVPDVDYVLSPGRLLIAEEALRRAAARLRQRQRRRDRPLRRSTVPGPLLSARMTIEGRVRCSDEADDVAMRKGAIVMTGRWTKLGR